MEFAGEWPGADRVRLGRPHPPWWNVADLVWLYVFKVRLIRI